MYEQKACHKCWIWKELTEFRKRPEARDGLTYFCESCLQEIEIKIKKEIKMKKSRILKECASCKILKPIIEFHKDDGYHSYEFKEKCKTCKNKRRRELYHENEELRKRLKEIKEINDLKKIMLQIESMGDFLPSEL